MARKKAVITKKTPPKKISKSTHTKELKAKEKSTKPKATAKVDSLPKASKPNIVKQKRGYTKRASENKSEITVVVTSCGRPHLLQETLRSFFEHADLNVAKVIVVEDSGISGINDEIIKAFENGDTPVTFVTNPERIGQIRSIDKAYALVDTKYIFHMEDDWKFYKSGFLKLSKQILDESPDIMQVWLRELNDLNGHPFNPIPETNSSGITYHSIEGRYKDKFHGFSFNPGLRRKEDYDRFAPFEAHQAFDPKDSDNSEIQIGLLYYEAGFRAVVLPEGYVMHTGEGQRVR